MSSRSQASHRHTGMAAGGDSLADILERVLDTGIVIAGDIRVQLADIELLTIQIRLVICSVERAEEMGMTWWKDASFLTDRPSDTTEKALHDFDTRLDRLEEMQKNLLEHLAAGQTSPSPEKVPSNT